MLYKLLYYKLQQWKMKDIGVNKKNDLLLWQKRSENQCLYYFDNIFYFWLNMIFIFQIRRIGKTKEKQNKNGIHML